MLRNLDHLQAMGEPSQVVEQRCNGVTLVLGRSPGRTAGEETGAQHAGRGA